MVGVFTDNHAFNFFDDIQTGWEGTLYPQDRNFSILKQTSFGELQMPNTPSRRSCWRGFAIFSSAEMITKISMEFAN